MTKNEARKACRLLEQIGMRETEIVRYESSWRVYADCNATGYRIHADHYDAVLDRGDDYNNADTLRSYDESFSRA